MNSRLILIVSSAAVCLATAASVLVRGRQLSALRSEQQLLLSQQEPPVGVSSSPPTVQTTPNKVEQHIPTSPSLEMLRLRSEVNRLNSRRRELGAARGENERLRVQLAASRTNVSTATALPLGYMRKSDARFVGYNTPAEAIQSLLWAIQNRDSTNFVAAFTPEMARQLQQQLQSSDTEEFFRDWSIVPGMHIMNQKQMLDGSIEAEWEVVPGEPMPERMRFRQINGQWKLDSH